MKHTNSPGKSRVSSSPSCVMQHRHSLHGNHLSMLHSRGAHHVENNGCCLRYIQTIVSKMHMFSVGVLMIKLVR